MVLTEQQKKQFLEDGFLSINKVFEPEELEPARKDIAGYVDDLANRLYDAGKIRDKCEAFDFEHRLTEINKQYPGSTILAQRYDSVKGMPVGVQNVFKNPKILDILQEFLGPNIMGHGVWNMRPKTPKTENHDVPWHQDSAYLKPESDQNLIITCWIPLVNTNAENGCLQFIKGGHRSKKIAGHRACYADTPYLYLENEDLEKMGWENLEVVTCPVPLGGIVMFTNLTPHQSIPNLSSGIRWSLDLRYHKEGTESAFAKPSVQLRKNGKAVVPDFNAYNNFDRRGLVKCCEHQIYRTHCWMSLTLGIIQSSLSNNAIGHLLITTNILQPLTRNKS